MKSMRLRHIILFLLMAVLVTPIRAGISTDYLLGGALTLKNGRIDNVLFDGGYAHAMETSATTDRFVFYYYNQDHLGNNREVVDIKGRIHQVTNYYPFGAPYADPAAVRSADLQPYKYNGKELDKQNGLNMYDFGARWFDVAGVPMWTSVDPLAEKNPSVTPYHFCHNDPINRIDPDGRDDHYTKNGVFIERDDKKTKYVFVGDDQLEYNGQPITGDKFNKMASTIYAESSIGYGIADPKEMCAIASVYIRNNIAYGEKAPLAKKFRATPLDKQNKNMQMANSALINALQDGTDYSNGASQWDGAEQAIIPTAYMDQPSVKGIMYKMNTMGWTMSNDNYQSWKNAINNKFGSGKFNVPQTKKATSNYGGMHNKGRIRLQSTAQHGLTIFWKELK